MKVLGIHFSYLIYIWSTVSKGEDDEPNKLWNGKSTFTPSANIIKQLKSRCHVHSTLSVMSCQASMKVTIISSCLSIYTLDFIFSWSIIFVVHRQNIINSVFNCIIYLLGYLYNYLDIVIKLNKIFWLNNNIHLK